MADQLTDEEIRDIRILLSALRGPSPQHVGVRKVIKRDSNHRIAEVYESPVLADEKELEDFWNTHHGK
jgi:hypothetical protein